MVRHIEDSVTVWFGIQISSTLLNECTLFAFRLKCGGNVSVWDIFTCPPNYISRRLHKIVKDDCYLSHAHQSVHMDQLRSDNIWYSSTCGKYVKKTEVSLKSDKNDDYYTVLHSIAQYCTVLNSTAHEHQYNCMIISLPVLHRMINIKTNVVEKIKTHILCSVTYF